jgi:uncharacterized membrane protein YeaQ/YmgE (transglycosylase-associated protein family)
MLGFIIGLVIVGLIAGFVARALVPGDDSMSIGATILLGIVGSFIGGFLADALLRNDADDIGLAPSGIIGSIVGAIIALLVYNAATRRRGVLR